MSTIRARRRKDGSVGYTARVRIRVKGQVIHQEIETFSTKALAEKWAKRREVELEDPKELDKARQGATTLASVIRWYIDCFKNVSLWQRSKQSALLFLEKHEIGTVDVLSLTTQRLVEHVRARRASGVSGSTAANDLIWISLVLEAAKAARSIPVNLHAVPEALRAGKTFRNGASLRGGQTRVRLRAFAHQRLRIEAAALHIEHHAVGHAVLLIAGFQQRTDDQLLVALGERVGDRLATRVFGCDGVECDRDILGCDIGEVGSHRRRTGDDAVEIPGIALGHDHRFAPAG